MKPVNLIKKKKITLATFKAFLKNNENLYIKNIGGFDGMIDGWSSNHQAEFKPLIKSVHPFPNNLGYVDIWVTDGGNRFYPYMKDEMVGIEVYNCCKNFVVAAKDPEAFMLASLMGITK